MTVAIGDESVRSFAVLARLSAASVLGLLFASNFELITYSALSESSERFAPVTISLELIMALLMIVMGVVAVRFPRTITLSTTWVAFILLLVFASVNIYGQAFVHQSHRSAITFLGILLVFTAGYWIAKRYAGTLSLRLWGVLWIFPLITISFITYLYIDGRLEFPYGDYKPQIIGGIRSSELSIFVGLQIIYSLYVKKIAECNRIIGVVNYMLLVMSWALLLALASVASIVALVLLFMTHRLVLGRQRKREKLGALLAVGVAVAIFSVSTREDVGELVRQTMHEKVDQNVSRTAGSRTAIYSELIELAMRHPRYGIGVGVFKDISTTGWAGASVYPHQNLLGLAAESGLVSALVYMVFAFWIAFTGFKFMRKLADDKSAAGKSIEPLLMLAVFSFCYLQLKGMVQDTWQMKEIYAWAGIIIGAIEYNKRQARWWEKIIADGRHQGALNCAA